MHKEVVDLVNEVKNEMKEMLKTQQSDLVAVIKETQLVILNNTLALQEMKTAIQSEKK